MAKKYFKKILLTSLFFVNYTLVTAQISNKFFYQDLKEKLPNDSYVVLEINHKDVIEIEDNKPQVYSYFNEKLLSLNKNAIGMSKRSMSFNFFTEITDISATAYIPKGKGYKKKKVKDFVEKEVIAQNSISFYSGEKEIEFNFEDLREGAVTEINTTKKIKDYRLINNTGISRNYYIKNSTYTIKVDNRVDLGVHQFNINDSCISYSKSKDKKYTYHKWEINQCDKKKIHGDESNTLYYRPTIEPYIKSYTIDGEKTEVFDNLDGLYSWYSSLIKEVDFTKSTEIKQLADSITKDISSEKEKVKAVYKWVQNNIKYIALGDGYGGFVPRDPDLVLQRRYGDCKDMSSITISLLDQIGIKSHFTWVGTRKIPFSYKEVSTPLVDNHMIVSYFDKEGQVYYLDPTDATLEMNAPSAFIQGKEVLIGLNEKSYKIDTVPIIAPHKNFELDTAYLSIHESSFSGSGKLYFGGYLASDILYDFMERDSSKQLDLMNYAFGKGNNKYYTKSFKLNYTEERNDSLVIDYKFEIPSYINHLGEDIYFNPNLTQQLKLYKVDEKQNIPYLFQYNNTLEKVYFFEIPKNYLVKHIAEDFKLSNDLLDCTIEYEVTANQISYHLTFIQKVIKLETEEVEKWNNSIQKITNELNNTIKLSKS